MQGISLHRNLHKDRNGTNPCTGEQQKPSISSYSCDSGHMDTKVIKVLCEQTREANKRIKIFFGIMFNISSGEVGHAPNCIMVEAFNQSGARIFLGANL